MHAPRRSAHRGPARLRAPLPVGALLVGGLLVGAAAAVPAVAQAPGQVQLAGQSQPPPQAWTGTRAFDLSRLDPAAVLSMGDDVLLRAPDATIDRLFKAVHASSRSGSESAALCALFEPDAARDVAAIQRAVGQLGPESRERFVLALADVALAGLQGQPQPFDPVHAQQVLKSAAVTAAFLHDGFSQGLAATADDAASREARCQSFRWLVGVLDGLPQADRVAATRWLLREGLTLVAAQGFSPA